MQHQGHSLDGAFTQCRGSVPPPRFTIHKALQRGVVPELVYPIAPEEIIHSWVEVETENGWVNLEGFILDAQFLSALQTTFSDTSSLCGYGAGTDCLSDPPVEWACGDTYIQKTGIAQDFGLFDSPDTFYRTHRQSFSTIQDLLYRNVIRHWMNARVSRIRSGRVPRIPGRLCQITHTKRHPEPHDNGHAHIDAAFGDRVPRINIARNSKAISRG